MVIIKGQAEALAAAMLIDLFVQKRRGMVEAMATLERQYLSRLLAEHEGNISQVARYSGLHRNTVARKLEEHGLRGNRRGE